MMYSADAVIALNGVLFAKQPTPHRSRDTVAVPAMPDTVFATGSHTDDRARKHLTLRGYSAWTRGRFAGVGVAFRCAGATTQPRDATHLPDDRLCDDCLLSDLGPIVYRYYGADGEPLYIGCTTNPLQRLTCHMQTSRWWPWVASMEVGYFDSHADALAAEAAAIAAEKPRYNRRGLNLQVAA
jgi:hypothetical protein